MLPALLVDSIIRRKARLHETPLDRYRVCVAHTVQDYEDAFKLLHVAYVFQGIEMIRGVDMRITPQHVLPESTVFVAMEGDMIVGTLTVTIDSPAGLPLDKDYPERLGQLRSEGARIVEFGSLAIVRRCWHTGVATLLNMAAYRFSYYFLKATHTTVGVNPKAMPFYRAVYNFHPLGGSKEHAELQAPVIGLVQDMREVQDFMRKHFDKPFADGTSVLDRYTISPPPCIELPESIAPEELPRWKMPRAVFQELFMVKSNRIDSLDPDAKEYLRKCRSRETLSLQGGAGLTKADLEMAANKRD